MGKLGVAGMVLAVTEVYLQMVVGIIEWLLLPVVPVLVSVEDTADAWGPRQLE